MGKKEYIILNQQKKTQTEQQKDKKKSQAKRKYTLWKT